MAGNSFAPATGRTWSAGVQVDLAPGAWGVRVAEFLGCGFRIALPADDTDGSAGDRAGDATAFGWAQVCHLADVLGAEPDEAPWRTAEQLLRAGQPVLLEGGWESVFRGPLGPPVTRLLPGRTPATGRVATGVVLPWSASVGSPLSSSPLISSHEETLAAAHVASCGPPGGVALWTTPDGCLTRSDAGVLLALHPDGSWTVPSGPGTVPTWLGTRLAQRLGARPGSVPATVLEAHQRTRVGLVAVDAWGSRTAVLQTSTTRSALVPPALVRRAASEVDRALVGLVGRRG